VLAGAIVGAIQGAILGTILGILGYTEDIALITGVTGFLLGIVISFFVFKWSIRKFILTQLSNADAQPNQM
jgi:high-affinity Fe2+/Pb2+ permease